VWVVYHRGPRAAEFRAAAQQTTGTAGLAEFRSLCDTGKPGAYEMRGNAARKTLVLATAKVESEAMSITWNVAAIFFVLGAKGMHDEVPAAEEFLREEGALPK
jgi:hypothetical protein